MESARDLSPAFFHRLKEFTAFPLHFFKSLLLCRCQEGGDFHIGVADNQDDLRTIFLPQTFQLAACTGQNLMHLRLLVRV